MKKIINILNHYFEKYGIILFAIVTLIITLTRTPYWDEAHSFDIASMKLNEIFQLTRIEGHTLIWYLLLKPFTNLNLYPYPMLLLNWFICLLAIIVLFKRAPFNPITKILIAFSVPFSLYFAPVARCYSIGILFLFLICSLYKQRFKKPYLYSFLILI